MIRIIDEAELDEHVQTMLRGGERGWAYTQFMEWVRTQPEAQFVGSTAAAKILGIPAPHVARLRRQGRMPNAIPVAGGYSVYVRSAVEALAKELRAERKARAAKQAA